MSKFYSFLAGLVLLMCCCQAWSVEYRLPDLDGELQSLSQYKGKWVVVNYWASWCTSCLRELPELVALHEKRGNDDIVVIGINFETISAERLGAFVEAHAIPYKVLRAVPGDSTPLGPVPALPTTYIIDPGGKTVAGEVGMISRQAIEDYIDSKKAETVAGVVVSVKL